MITPRAAAGGAAALLAAALGAVIAVTTPWNPLGVPVPGGLSPLPPSADFTAAEIARERAFHAAVHPPSWTALAVGLIVVAGFGATPLGPGLVRRLGRVIGEGWVRLTVVVTVVIELVAALAAVGFDAWVEVVLRRYDLSTQSWGGWAGDQGKAFGVTVAVTVVVLLAVQALARRLPRWWWAPAAAVAGALVIVGSFAYPLVVEPLYAHFHPLPAGPLRTSLLAEAHSAGVDVHDVLVSDASARTTELNAYVSGFGSSRRIVLYDTLLKEPPAEIRFVVAHELGHAAHNDVLHGTIEGALGAALGVCVIFLVITPGETASRRRRALPDAMAVPALIALGTWLAFVATPVQNLVSRHIEAHADAFALDLTHDPVEDVRVQRLLAVRGLSTLAPHAVVYVMFFNHPSPVQRIAQARAWARIHGVSVPPTPPVPSR